MIETNKLIGFHNQLDKCWDRKNTGALDMMTEEILSQKTDWTKDYQTRLSDKSEFRLRSIRWTETNWVKGVWRI